MRQQRRDDLDRFLDTEVGSLFQCDLLIPAEIADAENIGLQRLETRQQGREISRPERMADVTEILDVELLADLEKAANHLVTVSIVRCEKRNLLAEFGEGVATDRP